MKKIEKAISEDLKDELMEEYDPKNWKNSDASRELSALLSQALRETTAPILDQEVDQDEIKDMGTPAREMYIQAIRNLRLELGGAEPSEAQKLQLREVLIKLQISGDQKIADKIKHADAVVLQILEGVVAGYTGKKGIIASAALGAGMGVAFACDQWIARVGMGATFGGIAGYKHAEGRRAREIELAAKEELYDDINDAQNLLGKWNSLSSFQKSELADYVKKFQALLRVKAVAGESEMDKAGRAAMRNYPHLRGWASSIISESLRLGLIVEKEDYGDFGKALGKIKQHSDEIVNQRIMEGEALNNGLLKKIMRSKFCGTVGGALVGAGAALAVGYGAQEAKQYLVEMKQHFFGSEQPQGGEAPQGKVAPEKTTAAKGAGTEIPAAAKLADMFGQTQVNEKYVDIIGKLAGAGAMKPGEIITAEKVSGWAGIFPDDYNNPDLVAAKLGELANHISDIGSAAGGHLSPEAMNKILENGGSALTKTEIAHIKTLFDMAGTDQESIDYVNQVIVGAGHSEAAYNYLMGDNMLVHKGEGISHPLTRQIEAWANNNKEAAIAAGAKEGHFHEWAQKQAGVIVQKENLAHTWIAPSDKVRVFLAGSSPKDWHIAHSGNFAESQMAEILPIKFSPGTEDHSSVTGGPANGYTLKSGGGTYGYNGKGELETINGVKVSKDVAQVLSQSNGKSIEYLKNMGYSSPAFKMSGVPNQFGATFTESGKTYNVTFHRDGTTDLPVYRPDSVSIVEGGKSTEFGGDHSAGKISANDLHHIPDAKLNLNAHWHSTPDMGPVNVSVGNKDLSLRPMIHDVNGTKEMVFAKQTPDGDKYLLFNSKGIAVGHADPDQSVHMWGDNDSPKSLGIEDKNLSLNLGDKKLSTAGLKGYRDIKPPGWVESAVKSK